VGARDVPPRVFFGRASRDRAMLAFESPVAAACAWHNDARTIFEMARSKRKKPATAAAVAGAADAAAAPGGASPEGGEPEPAAVQCLCGDVHTGTYAVTWAQMENTRLVEVFCDPSMRDAVSRLGSGRPRDALDANLEDPWVSMAALYNSPSFKPDPDVNEPKCADCKPGHLRFHHTRTPDKLKEKFKELKKNLTVVTGNYEKSGQNDPDKTAADFCGDDAPLLYCWLKLEKMRFLEDFGVRRLPDDVGHEDGSPPEHDDAPGADAPPTVPAAPAAAKRRRSEPARTATHVVPAPAATTGVSLDHALGAAVVGILTKQQAGMQAPPPPPPPTDALSAEDRETVELIVMGMNAASDGRKEKLGETLQHVIDMRIARVNAMATSAMATSGGDDEMA
jgi:hypothetical protein